MENFLSDHQTVGTLLKQERERQGKSLSDVSDATHIRKVFLEYIEEDRFEDLPSKLHITGFLNVYSHYLGISEQLVLTRYKRQMFLLQEIPSEEIFSISLSSQGKKIRLKPWIYLAVAVGVFLFIFLLFKSFSYSRKPENSQQNILSPDHSLELNVQEGEDFTFFLKGKEIRYRLLDMTNQSVTLMDVNAQITFPPFLYTEGLEYDMDGNQEYDYMIYAKEKKDNILTFKVSMIHTARNPGQDSYAIVQLSHNEALDSTEVIPKKGILTLKNTGEYDLFIITENINGDLAFSKILPQQSTTVSYFDAQLRPLYRAVFLQDTYTFHIDLDGQEIAQGKKGAVGVLSCSVTREQAGDEPMKCSLTEGV